MMLSKLAITHSGVVKLNIQLILGDSELMAILVSLYIM